MHGGGPIAMFDDLSCIEPGALSLEQRIALVERNLQILLGVVRGIHEELEHEADDEHIDP